MPLQGLGNKPLSPFTEFREAWKPGLFGRGENEQLGTGALRSQAAEYVRGLMATQYGPDAAEAALRSVHNKTGRLRVDEKGHLLEMTRGDLELLHQELQKTTTFTQLHERFGIGRSRSGEGEYLHVEHAKDLGPGQVHLDARAPLIPGGGQEEEKVLERRQEAARLVKQALANEYGREKADAVLRKVRNNVYHTEKGRFIDAGMTRGDLELLQKELHKTTFTQILGHFGPVLLKRSEERVRGDGKQLYLHAPWMWHSNDDAGRKAKFKAGAEVVRRAIINEYGETVAKAALAAVSKAALAAESKEAPHDLGEEITLGDLVVLSQELPKQQEKYRALVQDVVANSRGHAEAVIDLYDAITEAHPNDRSPKAMFERFEGLKAMANDDWQAKFVIEVEPPDEQGRWAFTFKIDDTEIYRSDRLQNGPGRYHAEFALRQASAIDPSPEAMFGRFQQLEAAANDDLKVQFKSVVEPLDGEGHWAFAFKIGDTEIYRSDRLQNGPGRYHSEFEPRQTTIQLLQTLGARVTNDTLEQFKADLVENWNTVKASVTPIEWPNSAAKVELRSQLARDYIERGNMQFNEKAGTLELEVDNHALEEMKQTATSEEEDKARITAEFNEGKKRNLTAFIRAKFDVGPEDPAFQNIANNILSYVHQGALGSLLGKMRAVVDMDIAVADTHAYRSTFTLSVTNDGNVRVDGDTSMPYMNEPSSDSVGGPDYSKYWFVRQDRFEISPQRLRSTEFAPADDLRIVRRSDTIEFASEGFASLQRQPLQASGSAAFRVLPLPDAAVPAAPQPSGDITTEPPRQIPV